MMLSRLHSRSRSVIVGIAAGAVMIVGLVGCTAPDADETRPSPSPTPSISDTPPPSVTEITDTPGSGENLVGARADSTVTTCELADGAWSVAGAVTNPTADPADYRIYVSLLSADGGTRALQQVDVDAVEPAAVAEWSTSIAVPDEGLSCVLRVERYAA